MSTTPTAPERPALWVRRLKRMAERIEHAPAPPLQGTLTRMVGLTLEAVGCQASIGDHCQLTARDGACIEAEVVGFAGGRLFLMPTGDSHGLGPNAGVIPRPGAGTIPVGPALLGRIIDGAAQPLDGLGGLETDARVRLTGQPINPLARAPISEPPSTPSITGIASVGSMYPRFR